VLHRRDQLRTAVVEVGQPHAAAPERRAGARQQPARTAHCDQSRQSRSRPPAGPCGGSPASPGESLTQLRTNHVGAGLDILAG
jgi:hypothetical protein